MANFKLLIKRILFTFWIASVTLVVGGVALPVPFFNRELGWKILKFWARINMFGARVIFRSHPKIEGLQNIPDIPAVVASNHQSNWDMLALSIYVPSPTYVVKAELFKVPVFGWWLKALGNVGIDRSDGRSATEAIIAASKDALDEGRQIIIFPEGSRTHPDTKKRYSMGVARIYGTFDVPCFPFTHNAGYSWSRNGFKAVPGIVTGRFLQAIQPGLSQEDFIATVETMIRSNMASRDTVFEAEDIDLPTPMG